MSDIDRLASAGERIDRVLVTTTRGTKAHPRSLTIFELAIEHAEAWANVEPPREGECGGTSNPVSAEEAAEIRRVHKLASDFLYAAPNWAKEIDYFTGKLYDSIQRLTSTVDPSKLPRKVLPGCESCARTEQVGAQRIGGCTEPVYTKAAKSGLCEWCYSFVLDALAETPGGRTERVTFEYARAAGCLPPVQAIDIMHRQSKSAASRWISRQRGAA